MSDPIPTDAAPSERARIEAPPPPKRLDALPVLYLVGFLILASALIYLWRHPSLPRSVVQDSAKVETLRGEMDARRQEAEALVARVAALEGKAAPAAPNLGPLEARIAELERRPAPAAADLGPFAGRVAALEGRPAPPPVDLSHIEARIAALEGRPPVDLHPVEGRIAALESRPPPPPPDFRPVEARIAAMEKKQADDAAALGARLGAAEAQGRQTAAGLGAITERAARFGRLQAAGAALEAGQRLGEIPGAPPALAKFALDAPPTESALRLSFNAAAEAAQRASQPAIMDGKPLLDRMWTRAQQSVTVRQGDRVLVGDPIAGVIQHARQQLDAGDLAGAVKALEQLAGPAKAAMAEWVGRAQSLLDARAAIAELAARG